MTNLMFPSSSSHCGVEFDNDHNTFKYHDSWSGKGKYVQNFYNF